MKSGAPFQDAGFWPALGGHTIFVSALAPPHADDGGGADSPASVGESLRSALSEPQADKNAHAASAAINAGNGFFDISMMVGKDGVIGVRLHH
jgi:hypothetical protein